MPMMLLTRDNYYAYLFKLLLRTNYNSSKYRYFLIDKKKKQKNFSMDTFVLTLHGLSFSECVFF